MGKLKKRFLANYQVDESTARLPKEYQEVEYIESSGTQYIDTNITCGTGFHSKLDLAPLEVSVNKYFMGATSGPDCYIGNSGGTSAGKIIYRVGTQPISTTNTYMSNETKYSFDITLKNGNQSVIVDNVVISTNTYSISNITAKIFLFGVSNNGAIWSAGKYRIYNAKFYDDNNQTIRFFIPCYRKSDNEAGLYDLVNGVFYANAGTGSFSVGEPVYYLPTEFQEVEYIESSGTQWIDTGLTIPSSYNSFKAYTKTMISSNTEQTIVGAMSGDLEIGYSSTANRIISWDTNGSLAYVSTESILNRENEITSILDKQNGTRTLITNLDGGSSTTDNKLTNLSNFTICLFAFTSDRLFFNGKVYSAKLYVDNILQRSFKPCYRKSDNEIGLYDCVNDVFYTNSGTGTFAKGENVYYTLPKEYQKVEWIESSGTQYVDTGINASNNMELECYAIATDTANTQQICSHFANDTRAYFSIYPASLGGKAYIRYANAESLGTSNVQSGAKIKGIVSSSGTQIYVNDIMERSASGEVSFATQERLYVFSLSMSYGASSGLRLSYLKIKQSNTQIRYFVPCYRKADNEIGLYDIVNQRFYANSGTGSFTKGADDYDLIS